jgi:hypothetical protein
MDGGKTEAINPRSGIRDQRLTAGHKARARVPIHPQKFSLRAGGDGRMRSGRAAPAGAPHRRLMLIDQDGSGPGGSNQIAMLALKMR